MRSQTPFILKSSYTPAGDQPQAIEELTAGLRSGIARQTLLGATGTGKTFTIANVIARVQKPTLVIAHNKTLAAQLAGEFREFFPDAAVHYFVSYYDYYQPEAYMPVTDTFIEKDAQINKEIDKLRHASTQALLTRSDVIIVASVSCIYGLGSPKEYEEILLRLTKDAPANRTNLMKQLIDMQFTRTTADLVPGTFRSIGNTLEIMPVSEQTVYRLDILAGKIQTLAEYDAVTFQKKSDLESTFLFPAKHFITAPETRERAVEDIKAELTLQLTCFEKEGKLLEAERIKRRTTYDLAMIREVGYCSGIENYSRHLSGKSEGEPPETLLSYFPHLPDGTPDFLTVIDESHVTLPQLHAMYAGDRSRKGTLVEFGFRLPSAKDNRPLQYHEFDARVGQAVYVSATPGEYEKKESAQIVQQIIRPTGLLDPVLEVRGVISSGEYPGQVHDFILDAERVIAGGGRVLATTLTKKMAEDLTLYLKDKKVKAEYLHSDIKTIDRIKILTAFRKGEYDCIVGVNLLREGLDLPEVEMIGIFDADKEGFLRSETSLIQTIGRAARNVAGRVILYADRITNSLEKAMGETNRRRAVQEAYNTEHGITPMTIKRRIHDIVEGFDTDHEKAVRINLALDADIFKDNPKKLLALKKEEMATAAEMLDFETAAILRDEIKELETRFKKDERKAKRDAPKKKKVEW